MVSFFKTLSCKWMTNKSTQLFYTVHLVTVKAVKLTSASIRWRIYFCNDIVHWDPASVLKTRPKELGSRTIWLKEFIVHIIISYWSLVWNTKVPLIIMRTSVEQSRHGVLNRENLLDKKIFGSTSRYTVHNNVFSTWNKLMILGVPFKLLQFENLDSRNGRFPQQIGSLQSILWHQ